MVDRHCCMVGRQWRAELMLRRRAENLPLMLLVGAIDSDFRLGFSFFLYYPKLLL